MFMTVHKGKIQHQGGPSIPQIWSNQIGSRVSIQDTWRNPNDWSAFTDSASSDPLIPTCKWGILESGHSYYLILYCGDVPHSSTRWFFRGIPRIAPNRSFQRDFGSVYLLGFWDKMIPGSKSWAPDLCTKDVSLASWVVENRQQMLLLQLLTVQDGLILDQATNCYA